MGTTVQDLLAAANEVVPKVDANELQTLMQQSDVVIVDVRDVHEVQQTGRVRGAIHIPRGMLEFRADASTAYYDPALAVDRTIVLYCASGGRSALAGKTLLDMGYRSVKNAGGFKVLQEAGVPTETA